MGHAYSAESLLEGKTEVLEGPLWAALNTLEEGAAMSHRLAPESPYREHEHAAARFEERARRNEELANLIGKALENDGQEAAKDQV